MGQPTRIRHALEALQNVGIGSLPQLAASELEPGDALPFAQYALEDGIRPHLISLALAHLEIATPAFLAGEIDAKRRDRAESWRNAMRAARAAIDV